MVFMRILFLVCGIPLIFGGVAFGILYLTWVMAREDKGW